jgi:OOP family OmpA-OmpF porin
MSLRLALIGLLVSACTSSAQLEGRLGGLAEIVEQAERNGAYQCAPRELALAQAHVAFAHDKLEQGDATAAESHYVIAAPNARAALRLSPAERCAPREMVVAEAAPPPQPGDRDGDLILDDVDECPDEPEDFDGFEEEDGCPDDQDTDGDGIPDARDLCVSDPEDADGQQDEDGCPDPDDDLDGILDADDRCRIDPEDRDGWRDEDGCPDPDNDGDSILDTDDQCPDEPGPQAERGCPRVYENVEVTTTHIRITQKIHFALNRAEIMADSFGILETVATVLTDFPNINLDIQGHTDSQGSDSHNQDLSDRRASAVRSFLVGRNISPARLVAHGFGESRPLESNRTRAGRARNRRVEFVRTDEGANSTAP